MVDINFPTNNDGVYLNVVTRLTANSGNSLAGWDVNPSSGSALSWFASTGGGYARGDADPSRVDNLAAGTMIDSGLSSGSSTSETTGATAFLRSSSGNLVGFRFVDESTSLTRHGRMRSSLGATLSAQSRTIVEYAQQSFAGVGILAGAAALAVPGSGLAGMMLAGVAGVGRRR